MLGMTEAQRKVAQCVVELSAINDRPPTRQEIADQMGFKSLNTVQGHLALLQKKGYVKLYPHSARGVVVTDKYFEEVHRVIT